jgi:hypothetical protein
VGTSSKAPKVQERERHFVANLPATGNTLTRIGVIDSNAVLKGLKGFTRSYGSFPNQKQSCRPIRLKFDLFGGWQLTLKLGSFVMHL